MRTMKEREIVFEQPRIVQYLEGHGKIMFHGDPCPQDPY